MTKQQAGCGRLMKGWRESKRPLFALLTSVVIGFCVLGPFRVVLWEGNYRSIEPGRAYRSAQPTAERLRDWTARDGIKTVINLRGRWANSDWHRDEVETAASLGMQMFDIDLVNYRLPPRHGLRELIAILDQCARPVLLHCRHGSDRTGLASAIYRLLYQNATIEEARTECRLTCGHTGYAFGWQLPGLFDNYQQWLDRHGRTHSPDAFREYAYTNETPGYFGTRLTTEGLPLQDGRVAVSSEGSLVFVVRAENLSDLAWVTGADCGWFGGVHLKVWMRSENADGSRDERSQEQVCRFRPDRIRVEPGEETTVKVTLPLHRFVNDSQVKVLIDMVDRHDLAFHRMGIGGSSFWIDLKNQSIVAERK